jgi:hypothetical protein
MNTDDIQKLIIEAGFKNAKLFISDGSYARPTTSYLTGQFYEFYQGWLKEHQLSEWRAKWDCDNFASTYYVFSQMCHVKSGRKEEGIAIGELFYYNESMKSGHAINMAVTEKGLMTIEPQNGQETKLSSSEKLSCWMIRF